MDKRIDVIVAVRNSDIFQRGLVESLKDVIVPDGWQVQIIGVAGSGSKAAIYDAAMKESPAKYKIYIDEGCRIANNRFLIDLLDIFSKDKSIGAVGVAGVKQLPLDGVFGQGQEFIGIDDNREEPLHEDGDELLCDDVMAVDGCFLATAEDCGWRKDLFKEDAYVVLAQCFEVRRRGKRVVAPGRNLHWVRPGLTDTATNPSSGQAVFLQEYGKEFLPLVAVLIPTYNRPEYFRQALESVLSQTYTNLEILVSDEGDNDLTEKLVQPYLANDKRIKYVHHKNFTAAENWSYLESHVNPKAEYVAWLMDDDLFFPEKIEQMLKCYLEHKGVALVTSKRMLIDEDGNELPDIRATAPVVGKTSIIRGEAAGALALKEMTNYIGEPSTVLIKKKYLVEGHRLGGVLYKTGTALGDVATWLYALEQGDLIYIREPLSCFRMHANQSQSGREMVVNCLISWALLIQHYWRKRRFLVTEKDYRVALCNYLSITSEYMLQLEKEDYDSELYRRLVNIYVKMAESLNNGYVTDFSVYDEIWD